MASSAISDPLNDIVKEMDLNLDDDIELFDDGLTDALNEELDNNPTLSKAVESMLQTPKVELNESMHMDEDQGDPNVISENIYEPIVHIKEEPLDPIPTEPTTAIAKPTHQPQYIDVRIFVRQDSAKRSPATQPAGSFMVPYLPGCLRESSTYRVMVDLASTFIKRSRPYQKMSSFFYIYIARPVFAYITKNGHHFTVTESLLTKTINKALPAPRITDSDYIPLAMTVSADVSPKYNLHHIKSLFRQFQQPAPMETYAQAPVHTRLGPPIARPFQQLSASAQQGESNKENDNTHPIQINESPQQPTYNPQAHCMAPKASRKGKPKNRISKSKKGKAPLQPRQLFNN